MRILYVTPTINSEGGLERVLSIKTNYFIEKFGYKIDIITQNNGFQNPFYSFNSKINFHDVVLNSNKFSNLLAYKKQIQQHIDKINPDFIVVCDFGLKGFLFPYLFRSKVPIVFEAHGSLFNESQSYNINFFSKKARIFKYKYKKFCSQKFSHFVVLSKQSLQEWPVSSGVIIPNPSVVSNVVSNLESKKVILIARHSYEKGIDFALKIWKKVIEIHPDWTLTIYGKYDSNLTYLKVAKELEIESNVKFYEPVIEIFEKYCESSISIMTSRSEGFPMALIEAMSCGLPVVAFDCPIGPKSIITNEVDGFLIDSFKIDKFADKLSELIENYNLRKQIGSKARENVAQYDVDSVMQKWKVFFEKA